MNKVSTRPIPLLALIFLNFICALLHFLFEYHLWFQQGELREFLLIENVLIGFVFLSFSIGLYFCREKLLSILVTVQLIWWIVFSITVVLFWNAVTTLSMFRPWLTLPLSESAMLLITGLMAIGICFFFQQRQHSYRT
jgi:hypothetical protein